MDEWAQKLIDKAPDRGVAEHVRAAVSRLLRDDVYLLTADANERSVSHRLALYLEGEFPDWHVDCEYNRDGHEPKRLTVQERVSSDDTHGTTVYPDIIVHKRGKVDGNADNLLAIEIKKSSGGSAEKDLAKLRALRDQLTYTHALFLRFGVRGDHVFVSESKWI